MGQRENILLVVVSLQLFGCGGQARSNEAGAGGDPSSVDDVELAGSGGDVDTQGSEGGSNQSGGSEGGSNQSGGSGGSGGSTTVDWMQSTDPVKLCQLFSDAFCAQFIECLGEDFSQTTCTEDPKSRIQCSRATAVTPNYKECMTVLTGGPCIGSLPAICDGVITLE